MFTLDAHNDEAVEAMMNTLDNGSTPVLAHADTLLFLVRVIVQTEAGKNKNMQLYEVAKRILTGADAATVARQINLAERYDRKYGDYAYWEGDGDARR